MLKAKEEIIDYGDECKNDFGDIESVLDGETSAGHGEYASDQIQNYAGNGPSLRALSFVVPVGWGCVLYQCFYQFAVPQHCQRIPVLEVPNCPRDVQHYLGYFQSPDGDYDEDC